MVSGASGRSQRHAPYVETLKPLQEAVMQFGHKQKKLRLGTRLRGTDLMHTLERWYVRLRLRDLVREKLRAFPGGVDALVGLFPRACGGNTMSGL